MPLEHEEQVTLLEWFDLQYPALRKRMAAVPNAGKMNATIGKRMNREGRRKGYPDLQLLVPHNGYHGLIIEMKRQDGGEVSPEQMDWLEWLAQMGYKVAVCAGFDAAKQVVSDYLRGFGVKNKAKA
ncbi:VRR-NUC domain-containing protein [Pseudomonas lundensis]|uniref:VRR-NUC domain-containing protein n=1 Tax=Pseudomonas lundensis TaxID=86185 RepID=UPI001474094E|nr:VRR-NUC domain-containing protein [Pseudomonas lundensis]NNA39255.1 VRR-NUC domain-containing protein [Pseudomonas lundensis]